MLIINKTHPKSWFRELHLDSSLADNLFLHNPKYRFDNSTHDKDVVVLQILCLGNNRGIFEIVLLSDYETSKERISTPSNATVPC